MKLIIGGYAQGKLKYAIEKYGLDLRLVWDGELPGDGEIRNAETEFVKERASDGTNINAKGVKMKNSIIAVNHFHNWIKRSLSEGGCPEEEISRFLDRYQSCIIISDEIGNGIIPVEKFEREYRERTGRILVKLAGQAEEVERVICGIGQKIK